VRLRVREEVARFNATTTEVVRGEQGPAARLGSPGRHRVRRV
jgi:hypothetical protein